MMKDSNNENEMAQVEQIKSCHSQLFKNMQYIAGTKTAKLTVV